MKLPKKQIVPIDRSKDLHDEMARMMKDNDIKPMVIIGLKIDADGEPHTATIFHPDYAVNKKMRDAVLREVKRALEEE